MPFNPLYFAMRPNPDVLRNIALEPKHAREIAAAAGLPFLVSLLKPAVNVRARVLAATLLAELAALASEVPALISVDAVPGLLDVLNESVRVSDGNQADVAADLQQLTEVAASALDALAMDVRATRAISAHGIGALIAALSSAVFVRRAVAFSSSATAEAVACSAASALGRIAEAEPASNAQVVAQHGAPLLLHALAAGVPGGPLSVAAAQALAGLTRHEPGRAALAAAGGIGVLVSALNAAEPAEPQGPDAASNEPSSQPGGAEVVDKAKHGHGSSNSSSADGGTVGQACSAQLPLRVSVGSLPDSLPSQEDDWLCPLNSIVPLLDDNATHGAYQGATTHDIS